MSKVRARTAAAQARPGLIRRLLVSALLLSALAWLAPRILSQALVIWDRPVNEVSIEGAFKLVSREHIAELLAGNIGTGFWQLDIQALQAVLERDPWIDRVSIRRRWPDRLFVEVTEQTPIARWADRGFVNHRGERVDAPGADTLLAALPRLDAEDRALNKMMQNYQTIAAMLAARNLRIAQISLDPRGSWTVSLDNGVDIIFGRHELQERMRLFARVFDQQLTARWVEVLRVDVRYHNGAAVAWRENTGAV